MTPRDKRNLVLLTLLATLLFADVLFLGSGFFHRDLFRYHYPMKRVVRESVLAGEFPYWNRYWSGGQPMAANPAYEVFYPPQWLIFAGSYHFGFNLHIVVHVYLALIGMYLFIRALGGREAAALLAAIAFGTGGFLLGSMTTLPTFFIWSWAPLAGWAVARERFAAAAAILAMQMLVFEPVALLQVSALLTGFLIARRRGRVVPLLLIGAFALAAVQIVPGLDHARDSVRSRGFTFDVVTDYSMPVIRPLELVVPRLFAVLDPREQAAWGAGFFKRRTPYLLSISSGVVIAILTLAGFLSRIRGALPVAVVCAISYVLAIGDATPLYRWLYEAGLRSIRYPEKFIAAAVFTLVVFAALVADRFLEGELRVRRSVRAAALAVLAINLLPLLMSGTAFMSFFGLRTAELLPQARLVWLGGFLVALAWAALAWFVQVRPWFLVALAALLVDTAWLGRETSPALSRDFFTPPDAVAALDRDFDTYTVFHRGEWTPSDPAYRAAHTLPPWVVARNALLPLTPAAWGVRSALELDFDETALLPTHDLLDEMMRRGNSGVAEWAGPFIESSNVRYVIDYPLRIMKVRNRGDFYLEGDGRAAALQKGNEATVHVETARPAKLIAAVTRHKYWRATIDGRQVPIEPARIAYQAVTVPAGRHVVRWTYSNPLILWSGVVSAAAWLALTILTLRRRRPRSGS
jgi:hypothetical protein